MTAGTFPSVDEREFRGESSGRNGKLGDDEEAPFGLFAIRGEVADQYPTPGLRCRSRSAADDCTLRNSSRRAWKKHEGDHRRTADEGRTLLFAFS